MAKKQNLSYREIETSLEVFKSSTINPEDIGYEILKAFGKSDADIRRYREGKGVLTTFGGLLIKGLFCYKPSKTTDMTSELENLKTDRQVIKAAPKIIAISDGKTLIAYDTRERETYENPLNRVYCDFGFFYPLCGVEKFRLVEESPADVKAAEKMAKLHDEIRSYNAFDSESDLHDLNIFIARLLFCFFAEDTSIFEKSLFTSSISRYTKEDGSDLSDYLSSAFNIMDVRDRTPETLQIISQFPYVNGGLFSKHIQIPKMSRKARRLLLECGELAWEDINPDIFGSMIQAVVNPDERANQGLHYTSVPNIMKVINPLFLDELRAEYSKLLDAYNSINRLRQVGGIDDGQFYIQGKPIVKSCYQLLNRISRMKFFDPACGSGNFLIITYKMLRLLEMDIFRIINGIDPILDFRGSTVVSLSQFYGIELLDFSHEIAMLSLWLAEHQMNQKFYKDFGVNTDALPLKNITQIVCGNACLLDWNEVCPHTKDEEVFVFGNPPYLGSRNQDKTQKKDMEVVFGKEFGSLDYIAAWFYKGGNYIRNTKAQCAFVSTNSICQGLQVALLWKRVLTGGVFISFAHTSFKWTNNARNQAAVIVVIVGISSQPRKRLLYSNEHRKEVSNISAYLFEGNDIYVENTTTPITEFFPPMNFGNMPADGGTLLFTTPEKEAFIHEEPRSAKYFKRLQGSEEFINGGERWCLWLYGTEPRDFDDIPLIKERINKLRDIRLKSSRPELASIPHLFAQITQPLGCNVIIIPRVSSEMREYIPMGYLDENNIVADSCMVIGTNDISIFGILMSKMHMAWVKTYGGRLEMRYRYSAGLCYNTFPFPAISTSKRKEISDAAEEVLIIRENYPSMTLADLYNPESMPKDLKCAHEKLDNAVESCYSGYPFVNDDARLSCLSNLYEKMTK